MQFVLCALLGIVQAGCKEDQNDWCTKVKAANDGNPKYSEEKCTKQGIDKYCLKV